MKNGKSRYSNLTELLSKKWHHFEQKDYSWCDGVETYVPFGAYIIIHDDRGDDVAEAAYRTDITARKRKIGMRSFFIKPTVEDKAHMRGFSRSDLLPSICKLTKTEKEARKFARKIKESKPRGYERDRKHCLAAKQAFTANLADSESAIIQERDEIAILANKSFDLIDAQEAERRSYMTAAFNENAAHCIELEERYGLDIMSGLWAYARQHLGLPRDIEYRMASEDIWFEIQNILHWLARNDDELAEQETEKLRLAELDDEYAEYDAERAREEQWHDNYTELFDERHGAKRVHGLSKTG